MNKQRIARNTRKNPSDPNQQQVLRLMEIFLRREDRAFKVQRFIDELYLLPVEDIINVLDKSGFQTKTARAIKDEVIQPLKQGILERLTDGETLANHDEEAKKATRYETIPSLNTVAINVQSYYKSAQAISADAKALLTEPPLNWQEKAEALRKKIKQAKSQAINLPFSKTAQKIDKHLDVMDRQLGLFCTKRKKKEFS